jgi:hypothetical protein
MPVWGILLLVFAILVFNAGGIAALIFQRATKVVSPSRVKYRVQLGPSGMPLIKPGGMSWLEAPFQWAHFLRQGDPTWSISAARIERKSLGPDLTNATFETFGEARLRFGELKAQIRAGDPLLDSQA